MRKERKDRRNNRMGVAKKVLPRSWRWAFFALAFGLVLLVAMLTYPKWASAFYVLRGDYFLRQARFQEAIVHYDHAIALDPTSANAYVHRGDTYMAMFEDLNALLDFNSAIQINPNLTAAFLGQGGVYRRLQNCTAAIESFTNAVELAPSDPFPYANRAECYERVGDVDAAIRDYEQVLRLSSPSDEFAIRARARLTDLQRSQP